MTEIGGKEIQFSEFDNSYCPAHYIAEKTSWRNRIYGVTATRGELYRIGITPNHAMRTSSLLWRNQEL